jgi:ribose transport system substrate-binding protein
MCNSRYFPLAILLCVALGMTACQRGKQVADGEQPTIALIMKTLNNPFFIDMQAGAEKAAAELGVKLLIQAAEREVDVEKQMQIIENLIQRKVAAICVTPSGSKEIIPAILKANKAGIPVLIIDTRVDGPMLNTAGGRIATFIGSDNVEGGRIAARYIVGRLGNSGKIAILEGIPGHETGDARLSGFHEIVDPLDGIEIATSQTANWERDQGFTVFQNMLQSHPDIEALFACSDLMALGAVEAIRAAGRTGDILVIGFDALNDAREAIKAGTMAGSVAQHPADMGRQAIYNAKRILDGQTVESIIPVQIELITRDKLEQ